MNLILAICAPRPLSSSFALIAYLLRSVCWVLRISLSRSLVYLSVTVSLVGVYFTNFLRYVQSSEFCSILQ